MPEPETQVDEIPWENRKERGFFKALRLTRQEILFHSIRFFSRLSAEGGFSDSLIFALLIGCVTTLIATIYSWFYFSFGTPQEYVTPIIFFIVFVGLLLLQSMGLMVTAGIFHLGFFIAGARQGFKATLKVVAYASVVELFALLVCLLAFSFQFVIPALPQIVFKKIMVLWCFLLMTGGMVLFVVYPFFLYFIGLRAVHKLSICRALCGFIVPLSFFIALGLSMPKQPPRGICPLRTTEETKNSDESLKTQAVVNALRKEK